MEIRIGVCNMNELIKELKETQRSLKMYVEDIRQDLEMENSKLYDGDIEESERFSIITYIEKLDTLINRTESVILVIDSFLNRIENDTGKKENVNKPISSLREYIKSKKG